MIHFTEQDIINAFPASEIRKAKPYAAREVKSIEWFDNRLVGNVKGTARSPYRQTIIVRESGQGASRRVTFNTTCSCPVSYDCKHSIALLLFEAARQQMAQAVTVKTAAQKTQQAIVSQDMQTVRYFESLYQETKTAFDQDEPEKKQSVEGVVWLLEKKQGKYVLEAVKSRRLKDGSWSTSTKPIYDFSRYTSGYYDLPNYMTEFDVKLAKLLELAKAENSKSDLLVNTSGYLLLQKLLSAGKLSFLLQSDDDYVKARYNKIIPVIAKPAIDVNFTWQSNPQGEYWLEANIPDFLSHSKSIPTEPAYLVEEAETALSLYQLNSAIASRILLKLLTPMPLAAEQLYDYWSPLYDIIKGLPPLPQAAIPDLQVHQPIAVLRLATLPMSRAVTQLTSPLIAGLSIRYGEFELKPVPQSEPDVIEVMRGADKVLVQRDLRFEEGCAFVLMDIGLRIFPVPFDDKAVSFFPSDANMMSLSERDWLPFMAYFTQLQEKGWIVEIESAALSDIEISNGVQVNLLDDDNDYALDATLSTSAGELPLLPLLLDYLAQDKALPADGDIFLDKPDGGFVRLPVAQLDPILQTITELYDRPINTDGQLRLSQFDVMGLNSDAVRVQGKKAQALRKVVSQLATVTGVDPVEPPTGLQATLRDYQQQGFNWLHFLTSHHLGGVLADDMGLGKTLQVITHLLKQQELGLLTKPALVVAPTSVVGNWMSELAKFAPSLVALRFDGANRSDLKAQIETSNVVLTSYALIQRDGDFWQQIPLHSVIVDEAQYVKNPKAKTAQVIRTLTTDHCLCLTGTPLENHLGELWSLFDFVMPGFLANETQFKKRYRTPIEQHGDQACQNRLAQRVSPFMLRRTKADVVTELPAKTEIIQRVTLDKAQWQLYSSVRLSMEKRVRELMAEKGLKRSHIEILDALLKLRQVCCDPSLVKIPAAEKVKHSAKLEVLVEMVQELTEEGRKILVFSQFATMLGIIEKRLNSEGISTSKLTGATRNRQAAIDAFVEGDAQVFLISLKAGGVGLNLTAADTVIHYDPWWNPAAEAQATDRAYRIGQDKPVFVYKLIVENTVEEKILVMQDKKRALADSVFGDEDALSVWSDSSTILNLFAQD